MAQTCQFYQSGGLSGGAAECKVVITKCYQKKHPAMETTDSPTIVPVKRMYLPIVDRSIRDENKNALLRRWSFASSELANDIRVCQQWFPGQRALLEVLTVLSEDEVVELADCGLPLFSIRTPMAAQNGVFESHKPKDAFQAEAVEEVFMALMSRLDSLRTSPTQASMLYDLQAAQASLISRHSPRELHVIATDPAVVLLPAVADEYFLIASTTPMTFRERTVLAGTARRKRAM